MTYSTALLLLGALVWFGGSPPSLAADAPPTPYQTIKRLVDRMYVAGETNGRFDVAIENARRALRAYRADGGDPAGLVEKTPTGDTPLLLAARMGYAEVVADLLEHEAVVARVNEPGTDGLSPWFLANFAFKNAVWVCNPTLLEDPLWFISLAVQQPYYSAGSERPYRRTRSLLEAAGATPDMDAARRLWLQRCTLADPAMRQRIATSDDLLATLEEEAPRALAKYMNDRKKP